MNTELSLHADDCECRACIPDRNVAHALQLGDAIYEVMKHECVVIQFPTDRTKARGEL